MSIVNTWLVPLVCLFVCVFVPRANFESGVLFVRFFSHKWNTRRSAGGGLLSTLWQSVTPSWSFVCLCAFVPLSYILLCCCYPGRHPVHCSKHTCRNHLALACRWGQTPYILNSHNSHTRVWLLCFSLSKRRRYLKGEATPAVGIVRPLSCFLTL